MVAGVVASVGVVKVSSDVVSYLTEALSGFVTRNVYVGSNHRC